MTGDQLDLTENSANESAEEITNADSLSEAPEKAPSVEDTVREAVQAARSDTDAADKTEAEQNAAPEKPAEVQSDKTRKKGKKGAQSQQENADAVEKYDPPVRWDVKAKEAFNQLPDVAKKQTLDFWNGIESHTTKLWQDLNRKQQRYTQLEQVINHYMPQWNLKNMTDVQAVAELCATQDLITKDPLRAMHILSTKTGVTPEMLHAYRQTGQAPQMQQHQQQQHQQQGPLSKEDIRNIFLETTQQQQSQQQLHAAVSEVEALRNETNSSGQYLFPELWDAAYLKRVEPLVEDIRRTQPQISWAEATKKALQTVRYLEGRLASSPSPGNPKLSREQELARVRNASLSVRGRGAVQNSNGYTPQKGERVEDTIRAVWARANENSQH